MLLAEVRNVGIQGDGRSYGHPVVRELVVAWGRGGGLLVTAIAVPQTALISGAESGAR